MHRRDLEGGDQRLACVVQGELLEVKLGSLAQIGEGFWDGLSLCRRARLRIQRDEAAFLRGNQNGGQNHGITVCAASHESRACTSPFATNEA
jgi:hypothetical protein